MDSTSATPVEGTPFFRLGERWRWLRSPLHLFVALCCLLPIAFVVINILSKGVNIPRWDEWDHSVVLSLKAAEGTLAPADLFKPNGETRLLFGNVTTVLLTYLTRWNLRVGMLLSVGIVALSFGLLLGLARRDQPQLLALVAVPFAALVFSLRQHTNWLWALQTSYMFTGFSFLAALYVLQRLAAGWRTLALAALLVALSTFSTLHGAVGWVVMAGVMWLSGYRKPAYYGFWLGALAFTLALHFTNYDLNQVGVDQEGLSAGLLFDPVILIPYALAYLGSPFVLTESEYAGVAIAFGIVGIALLVGNSAYLLRRKEPTRQWGAWVAVAGFAMGAALVTAMGRARLFDEVPWQALLDRYSTFANYLWIGVIALGALVIWRATQDPTPATWGKVIVRLNVIAFVLFSGIYLLVNGRAAIEPPLVPPEVERCVIDYPSSRNTACLINGLYLNYQPFELIVEEIDRLAVNRLTAFASEPPELTEITLLYNVERRVEGEQRRTGFTVFDYNDAYSAVTFMQYAPSTAEFRIDVPQTDQHVELQSAAYVDPSTLSDTSQPQDGVVFRVGARDEDGNARLLVAGEVDPNVDARVRRVIVDLDAYKGQTIWLILQTQTRDNANYDQSMWLDPRVIVRPE